MVSKSVLLQRLPPYNEREEFIKDGQDVSDIIVEVVNAHKAFETDYNAIASFFISGSVEKVCRSLFDFCKKNILYEVETEEDQTTRSPAAIVELGHGDCKHYAGFIGGVLGAINRSGRKKIKWRYRFASYNLFNKTPGHVFIVVDDGERELWVDPVLEYFDERLEPYYITDRKINDSMSLSRLSGVGMESVVLGLPGFNKRGGGVGLIVRANTTDNNLNYDGSNKYTGAFAPYLGLTAYSDYESSAGTDFNALAAQLNDFISKGPNPGHTVDGDFVKWIFDENVRSWNFYYPGGVRPGFNADSLLPANWPRLIIAPDGRLTFDRDILLDDYRNAEIHLLTAWAQSIINAQDPSPYPVKPRHLKEFSQLKQGNVDVRNLFTEARGDSLLKEIGQALEKYVNVIKDGVLMIVGSIPRNAFLVLVRNNVHNFATHLQEKIQAGRWDELAKKWKSFGGLPDKLKAAIDKGSARTSAVGIVPYDPTTESPKEDEEDAKRDWAADLPGLLGAAAAIIKLLISFFDKNTDAQRIAAGVPFNSNSSIYIDPRDDENLGGGNNDLPGSFAKSPILIAALASAAAYFLAPRVNGKRRVGLPLLIGGGIYLLMSRGLSSGGSSAGTLRDAVRKWGVDKSAGPAFLSTVDLFTAAELSAVADYLFNYIDKGTRPAAGSELYNSITAISSKYNIFT